MEIGYYHATGHFIRHRDFHGDLERIFRPTPDPKIQENLWTQHQSNWYRPHRVRQQKNFYAPWIDYILVKEMLLAFNL